MIALIGLAAMFTAPIALVMLIVQAIRRKPKKAWAVTCAASVVIFFLALMASSCSHSWSDATCTQPKTCSNCGQTEGSPIAHRLSPATCEFPAACTVCGTTEGAALGHTVSDWKTSTPSTCAAEGSAEGVCSTCTLPQTKTLPLAEHTSGDWSVLQPATASAAGVEIQRCTVCSKELNRREFTMSPEEQKALYISQCSSYKYSSIARNPDSYKGKYAALRGEVIQVMEDGLSYTLRVNITKGSYGFWSDTILVTYTAKSKDEDRILEDDIVKMYGMLGGTYTYETVLGSQLTIPILFAEYIDIQ